MKLGMLTACLPGRSLETIAGWAAGQGHEALDGAYRTLRPLIVAQPRSHPLDRRRKPSVPAAGRPR